MRLARIKLRLAWGAAGVAIGVLLLTTAVSGAHHANSYRHQQEVATERIHFWQMVDGEETALHNVAEAQLASDLRKALGAHNSDAKLPAAIINFYGDSDIYGPARSELGFNPFTGASGPLTSSMKAKLLLIKRGQLQSVVASEEPRDSGKPLSWWFPLILLVLWLAAGLLPWIHRRRSKKLRLQRNYPEEYRLCEKLNDLIKDLQPGSSAYLEATRSRQNLQAIMRGDESLEAQEVLRQARLQIEARESAAKELEQEYGS